MSGLGSHDDFSTRRKLSIAFIEIVDSKMDRRTRPTAAMRPRMIVSCMLLGQHYPNAATTENGAARTAIFAP
jgi:hypothetical protein